MFFNAKQYFSFLKANPNHQSTAFRLAGLPSGQSVEKYSPDRGYYYEQSPPSPELTEAVAQKALDNLRASLVKRETQCNGVGTTKWLRPWTVVPELINFTVPKGDFGVGIEVEMGFKSLIAAQKAAEHIADWEYVTLDYEGGDYPIEATFAPELASNIDNMLAVQYLDYLDANKKELVRNHAASSMVGTHVNVSMGGVPFRTQYLAGVNTIIGRGQRALTQTEQEKYFGRAPYGQGNNFGKFIEWKLFNSQTDSDRLKQYINIAIELTRLAEEGGKIKEPTRDAYGNLRYNVTREDVIEACERGYNKERTPKGEVATPKGETMIEKVVRVARPATRRRAA